MAERRELIQHEQHRRLAHLERAGALHRLERHGDHQPQPPPMRGEARCGQAQIDRHPLFLQVLHAEIRAAEDAPHRLPFEEIRMHVACRNHRPPFHRRLGLQRRGGTADDAALADHVRQHQVEFLPPLRQQVAHRDERAAVRRLRHGDIEDQAAQERPGGLRPVRAVALRLDHERVGDHPGEIQAPFRIPGPGPPVD